MASFFLMGLLFLFIFVGIPVGFATAAAAVVGVFLLNGNPMQIIPQTIFAGMNYFPLVAVPFFILAGELMNTGGITERIVHFASLLVGRLPAGLAHTNILTAMFFGGVTGSAAADAAAVGGVLIPAMEKEGYPKDFTAGLTACSTIMGPIIPPSIMMVIYGSTVGVSIGALFAGGVIPGVLIAFSLMITVLIMDRVLKLPRRKVKVPFSEAVVVIKEALLPLMMPVIIMGGILGGIFTPTEAGAVAVLYALVVGFFVLKTLKVSQLIPMLRTTAIVTSTVLFILGAAGILGWVFTVLRVQFAMAALFTSISDSPIVFLLLVNIALLLIGTFMDSGAGIILFAPILAPIAAQMGIDPVHFGLIMVINLTLGQATPPLGMTLFISCGISKLSLEKVSRAVIPFLTAEFLVLIIISYLPQVTLWIPRLMHYVK